MSAVGVPSDLALLVRVMGLIGRGLGFGQRGPPAVGEGVAIRRDLLRAPMPPGGAGRKRSGFLAAIAARSSVGDLGAHGAVLSPLAIE